MSAVATAQRVTLVDGDERRTQLIGPGFEGERMNVPRLVDGRWHARIYYRAPEFDRPGDPPAFGRVE